MDNFLFTHWTVSLQLGAAIGVAAGALLGFIHFMSLKWNTQFYLSGDHGKALALHFGRFAILIVALTALAKVGAVALLVAMASMLAVRAVIVRRERNAE